MCIYVVVVGMKYLSARTEHCMRINLLIMVLADLLVFDLFKIVAQHFVALLSLLSIFIKNVMQYCLRFIDDFRVRGMKKESTSIIEIKQTN